ncbi:NAD(P)-binding protein [Aulographum hederae CBS 113979]|uniref:NAD(P)-binding protein n=1 Tax=Aulographum hederae CBS 113979 TaxID=1176131 RepID=A0A6G1HAC8_9PEZI|nr:NAD(P)-binding protein [Aulographum hederae CBS 113979]
MNDSHSDPRSKPPQFPSHNGPRVWFITNGASPVGIGVARQVLEHGDFVVAGVLPEELDKTNGNDHGRAEDFKAFLDEVRAKGDGNGNHGVDVEMGGADEDDENVGSEEEEQGDPSISRAGAKRWKDRVKVVGLDGRNIGQCQAAVAEAVHAFGKIDIMLGCSSEAIIGTIEELAQSHRTQTLFRSQFETNFFANVNIIKAILPTMRSQRNGHIVMLTGITAHLGTPGMGMYCSSQWALEGYCDSLAYEIAPFNVKLTLVQPNLEIGVLSNMITSAPPMQEYRADVNPAPLSRDILSGLLDKLSGAVDSRAADTPAEKESPEGASPASASSARPRSNGNARDAGSPMPEPTMGDLLHSSSVTSVYPPLQPVVKGALVAETVYAIAAIGGHDNPPARHIVGSEAITSVKEKLKTVSEELEDFIESSMSVDFAKNEGIISLAPVV